MSDVLDRLAELLEQRKSANPDSSYVARLYAKGMDSILKKVGEEATETVIAAKGGNKDEIIYETADLWFHTLIMLAKAGLKPQDVLDELARREGLSGIVEKENRSKWKLIVENCLESNNLNIGEIYYMVQREDDEALPEITSFVYSGLSDDGDVHIFKAKGMTQMNLLLKERDLSNMMNFSDLKYQLSVI